MPVKWATAKFLIPARNSRHRTACLALYRALLKQALLVPLPDDVRTLSGPRNPVAHIVERSFRRNRNDTSTRLVYPALKAGYRSLDLLHRARTPDSPEHRSVLSFLAERLAERTKNALLSSLRPPVTTRHEKPSSAPSSLSVPLLQNVTPAPTPSNPNPKPVYAAAHRPRPRSELPEGGRRRIPVMDMASDFPFLRLSKPQPQLLTRVLNQKIKKRVHRLEEIRRLHEDVLVENQEEDDWEKMMYELLGLEDPDNPAARQWIEDPHSDEEMANEDRNMFQQTVYRYGIIWLQDLLNNEREDNIARADAMRKLIADEKALLQQEKEESHGRRKKKWQELMQETHGAGWEKVVQAEHEERVRLREERMQNGTQARRPVSYRGLQDARQPIQDHGAQHLRQKKSAEINMVAQKLERGRTWERVNSEPGGSWEEALSPKESKW